MKSDKSGKPGNGNLGSMKRTLESNLIKNSNAMYFIQVRALLEHQTVFWRPHLWKTWTHPTSPEGSSVDGGGKVLDISSLINLLISQMDLSLFSLEWWDFPGGSEHKQSAMQEAGVQSLGWEDPLEKGMATHSSILA